MQQFGWKCVKKVDVNEFVENYNQWRNGRMSLNTMHKEMNVDRKTIKNWLTWMILTNGNIDRCPFIKNPDDYIEPKE